MSTNENKGKKTEVTALQAISAEDRKDWISLAFVQAGICVCVPAFLLGALLAEAMPIWPAIISGSLGYLIVVVGMVATGMIGCDLGLASCTCCQAGFGKSGARFIVSTIFAVNMIGWFGIQNGVCGEAFSNAMLAMTGWDIPVVVSNTIWGIIMLLTAVYGVHALEKLDKISIPLLMIIMCYGTFLAFKVYGTGNLNDEGTVQSMSFMSGVALSFNFTAVGTITGPDYTRFQKSRKDTVKSVFYGVFPMGVITLIMGIVLTKLSGQYDISMVLIEVGLPLLGIIALVISTWTTNSTNAYSAGLNIVMALKLKDNRRREATLISGIVGIVLCDLGILGHVEGVLSLLSYVVCPVGGVILADYWVVGKGKAKNFRPQDGVNWAGVIAWALGAIISYTLVKIEFVGIIIGFVIYRSGRSFSHPDEHLVDRVDPAIPVSDVYLLVPEHHAFRAVGVERPGIAVRGLPRAGRPGLLQTLPPAGLERFIQIGAYTDVRILRYQLQGAIARGVEAPGGNHFHRYLGAPVPQLFHGRIGRARVQHHDPVRL